MEPHFDSDPFTLGVASGSPRADSIVLWTRLAPDPLAGGGMQPANVDVRWEVAHDEGFHDIARTGVATAMPELAHSVRAEAAGLEPERWYWYRFMAGNSVSAGAITGFAGVAGCGLEAAAWLAGFFISVESVAHSANYRGSFGQLTVTPAPGL